MLFNSKALHKRYKRDMLFFWQLKLKPTNYVLFFNIQEKSDALTASIYYSSVYHRKKEYYTSYSTSVKDTSSEALIKIT